MDSALGYGGYLRGDDLPGLLATAVHCFDVPAGILLSAAAFGAAHAYQGFRMVILIGLYGAMFGILAHWRGSVRPGIIAHAWQDSLNGVLVGLSRQ